MSLGSVLGLVIALFLVVPGGLGDRLMYWWHGKPDTRDSAQRVLAYLSWSTVSLALVEIVPSLFGGGSFGNFLLTELNAVTSLADATQSDLLWWRYLVYVAVATLMPVALRAVPRSTWFEKIVQRTLDESSVDRAVVESLSTYRDAGTTTPFVRAIVDDFTVEGWLLWSSTPGQDPQPALILRAMGDRTLHWVPTDRATVISFVDQAPRSDDPADSAPPQQ